MKRMHIHVAVAILNDSASAYGVTRDLAPADTAPEACCTSAGSLVTLARMK
jgi:hypothetical protein